MSSRPSLSNVDNTSRDSRGPIIDAFEPSSSQTTDPFDTPLFHRLIGFVEQLHLTVQEQNVTAREQKILLEDVKKALVYQCNSIDARENPSSKANIGTPATQPPDSALTASPLPRQQKSTLAKQEPSTSTRPDNPDPEPRDITSANNSEAQIPARTPDDRRVENSIDASVPETPKGHIHDAIMILNETMKSVKDTLLDHGTKLSLLIRDALKDDQPYDEKPIDDESACTALFEIAMARTKEEVDEWIKRMDVSLVFIALFSAVLTAFVVPANQNLFPSSNNTPGNPTDCPPPAPNVSAQDVCILYYLALILSILDAVLSVLGRQWMSKLTNKPIGSTYRERLLRHIAREELAKRWLGYLVEGLHILLLWSIGLFMTGLLYQIFNLSGSFEQSTPRILAAWAVGVVLSSGILVVVLAATTHALVYEVSPFGGPVSKVLFQSARVMSVPFDWLMGKVDDIAGWLDCRIASIPFYRILPVVGRVLAWPLWLCSLLVDQWRVKLDQSDRGKLLKAFMDLMSEASDPKLLERAVGSFSYIEWSENGKGAVDQLEKTRNRLMATDTSVRVRETLRARAKQLAPSDSRKLRNMGERLTKELVQFFLGIHSYPRDFGGSLRLFEFEEKFLDTSFGEDNTDLRPLAALPFEECVARVLCSYNHEGKLGDRRSIFDLAEIHCWRLLREGKVDDVTRILSHVDRLDLIKSYIQVPGLIFPSVVKFIVKDDKHEILRKINEFVREIDQSRLGPQSLSKVFSVLASPPPTNLDLSPLIDHFSRHPRYRTWWEISDIITAYLSSFDLPQLSDSTAVRQFLQQCVDTEFRNKYGTRYPTNNKTRARARDLLAELNRPPSSPTGPIASTSNQPASPSHSPSNAPILSNASQPDHLLSPSPASESIDVDAFPSSNSRSDIPMIALNLPPPVIPSSESKSDPPLVPDAQVAFDQSPVLENAERDD